MSSVAVAPHPAPGRGRLRGVPWFVFVVGMWGGFAGLLAAGRLDEVWRWIRDLPLLLELLAWFLAFPWVLATAAWESSWETWLRALLVALFVAGWTLASVPRRRPSSSRPGMAAAARRAEL